MLKLNTVNFIISHAKNKEDEEIDFSHMLGWVYKNHRYIFCLTISSEQSQTLDQTLWHDKKPLVPHQAENNTAYANQITIHHQITDNAKVIINLTDDPLHIHSKSSDTPTIIEWVNFDNKLNKRKLYKNYQLHQSHQPHTLQWPLPGQKSSSGDIQ